ncbi:MAG TPA: hypothetical protein VJY62_21080 [Bacteroidia bacterium]|nr:hypothetical protein [Bacteroidia bacterium]
MHKLKCFIHLSVLFFTASLSDSYAQWNYPFLAEYFFVRNPSARMEAMGKTYAPSESEISCVFKNPAGVSNIKGVGLDFTYSNPLYLLKDANFLFAGAGCTFNKYISAAVAVNRFDFGISFFTDNAGNPVPGSPPALTNYSFSLASSPFKNFTIGVTMNYFIIDFGTIDAENVFYPDIGAIKYFDVGSGEKIKHKFFIAQSLSDFTKSSAVFEENNESYKSELPFISRTGIGYNLRTSDSTGQNSLRSHEGTFAFEYEEVLNSEYETSFRFGLEYKLFHILSLRAGYYHQKIFDYGYPEYNKSEIGDFTYGIGFSLPLEFFSKKKTPFTIRFDFANMRQTPQSEKKISERFTSISLSLHYVFKKTKM